MICDTPVISSRLTGCEPARADGPHGAFDKQAAMALHDSDERLQVIADALSSRTAAESNRSKSGPSGTQRHDGGEGRGEYRRPARRYVL
jgi:hypothetical protein